MSAAVHDEQISRRGLAWLLIAQAFILAPHAYHAPLWLWGVWLPVVIWRWQIFRGAWSYPGFWLRLMLVSICAVGLYLALRGKFGMQAMVCLLLVGFILKLLEMRRKRDFLVLCYLGYFVIATQLLFFSEVYAALYALLCLFLLTTALLAVNQSSQSQGNWRSAGLAGGLLLQAVPLMLLLFLALPRFGPFWAVPLNTAAAITGMSDSMSPGDISDLMQSDQVAFRVTFSGENPRQSQLYWRGLVFSHFDGRRWTQTLQQRSWGELGWAADSTTREWMANVDYQGEAVDYDVIMEPSNQPWLFSLAAPRSWSSQIGLGRDLWLQRNRPVNQRIQYSVTSHPTYLFARQGLSEQQLRQELSLPADINPRTLETARAWMAEAGSVDALINRLLAYFNREFTYTLKPGVLGEHGIDEFLWENRRGFCEHFSSSFAVFMRAAGVPARVVVGYQGGGFNARENYWVVRQRDAHAWTEVWLAGRGWVMIDPTAAVAPERIERGIDYSLSDEDAELLGNSLARSSSFIGDLALRWDALNYQWARWVLNYDAGRRQHLLGRWLGNTDAWRVTLMLLGAGGVIILGLALYLLRQPTAPLSPWDRQYRYFQRKLARVGLVRAAGEAPRDFAHRVASLHPQLAPELERITRLYELAAYSGNPQVVPDLTRAVQAFKPVA